MTAYAALKIVHLLGVTLFVGNIIVTALWKTMADRTDQPTTIAYAQRLVTLTDCVFTAGGVALLLIGGYGMVYFGGLNLRDPWLVWGQALFAASGVIWILVLIPIQIAQARLARDFENSGDIPRRYWRLEKWWVGCGILATILPLINFYVMIFKP